MDPSKAGALLAVDLHLPSKVMALLAVDLHPHIATMDLREDRAPTTMATLDAQIQMDLDRAARIMVVRHAHQRPIEGAHRVHSSGRATGQHLSAHLTIRTVHRVRARTTNRRVKVGVRVVVSALAVMVRAIVQARGRITTITAPSHKSVACQL
ncbi:MAG: hypothetical protein NVS4B9_22770 [Ktedonobacteraceae bacterium]